jgi:hypothetical protein
LEGVPFRGQAIALTMFFATVVGVPAFAQPPPSNATAGQLSVYPECKSTPSKGDSEAAHGAYLAGKGSFDEADYTTAINYFKDAYRRDCTKYELLNIIARAYELRGDRAEAVNALETYLKRVPQGDPGNEAIQRRISNLKAQLAAQPPPSPTASATVTPASAAPTSTPPVEPGQENPPAEPDRKHTIFPWLVVGAGTVLAGVGLAQVVIGGNEKSESRERAKTEAGCDDNLANCTGDLGPIRDQNESATSKQRVGAILMGVGGAAIAGGLLWHFLEPTGPSGSAVKVKPRPDVRPGYAGLSFSGSF